jgi:hypothetical protein
MQVKRKKKKAFLQIYRTYLHTHLIFFNYIEKLQIASIIIICTVCTIDIT